MAFRVQHEGDLDAEPRYLADRFGQAATGGNDANASGRGIVGTAAYRGSASSELRRSHERLGQRHEDLAQANRSLTEAADELRSTNAQIEFLLRRALAEAGRLPSGAQPPARRGRPPQPR